MSPKRQTPESNSRRIATFSENARKVRSYDDVVAILRQLDFEGAIWCRKGLFDGPPPYCKCVGCRARTFLNAAK